ncbi:response regulator [Nocardia cyriacigeorgica]|uniref:response regulator n=1 Tax=Nocardia cyriacigeorgica TaxID=135487 RepID=UPI001893A259|nr:response regulator transcription factor [Nocardia cyriacigeorgica]MBF6416176.1 response regulator transcription factor [Nocardia cyriacigeorgica]
MTIRVVIADDQELVREGLAVLLGAQPDIEVVAQVADGHAAVREAKRHRPEVVLMDVRMPVCDGIEATRRISASVVETRVIVLTTFDLDEYVYAAIQAGASGFLLKESSAQALGDAVRVVARGDALLAPSVTRRLLTEFAGRAPVRNPPTDAPAALTARETEVLILIARGLSNIEIARELVISEQTVKTHVGRILDKLQLRDRTQAAIYAYEARLIHPR